MKNIQRGFTLIELLIVIGIIAILASAIIIAINPGQQFAQARDATRQGHINSINKAILSYMISHYGDLSALGIAPTATEICASDASSCTGLIDLTPLVSGGHLSTIPTDPSGGVDSNGTGYFISQYRNTASISSYGSETRNIGLGPCPPTLKDIRDNNVYKTVQIGSQCWMAENLKATQYTNGEAIPTGHDNTGWTGLSTGAYTVFNHTSCASCDTTGITSEQQVIDMYGLLYNGYATNDARGICPTGWRVSTDDDWKTLEMYLGMTQVDVDTSGAWRYSGNVGQKLKSSRTSATPHPRWNAHANSGIDSVGFSALPGGCRVTDGVFYYLGASGFWWSFDGVSSFRRNLNSDNLGVSRYTNDQRNGFSVRCLKN